jgi:hypothetical protein
MGDKPAGLTQAYWATGNRRVIPWDVINRLAEDDPPCKTSNGEDNIKGVVNGVHATSVKEGKVNVTPSEANLAKLPSWSRWPSSRPCGACCRTYRCCRRPRTSRGRSAR